MKRIIDIPEEIVTDIKDYCGMSIADAKEALSIILNAIHNGTPLPKGHGRLIDADALNLDYEVEMADDWKTAHEIANCVKYAPAIIEADKGEQESRIDGDLNAYHEVYKDAKRIVIDRMLEFIEDEYHSWHDLTTEEGNLLMIAYEGLRDRINKWEQQGE